MNKPTVPTKIIQLIAIEEHQTRKQAEEKAAKEYQEHEERRTAEQHMAEEYLVKVLPMIPDVIQPYVFLADFNNRNTKYELHWSERAIEFHVPALAPFIAVFTEEKEEIHFNGWKFSTVVEIDWDEDSNLCKEASFGFRNQSIETCEIEQVLRRSLQIAVEQGEAQNRLNRQFASYEINESLRKKDKAEREAASFAEEMALLNSIKDDPIAIHMLKAFILLRDERSTFEERIYEMDESMSSIENRWSRKAEDLRRQAGEMQRRADDEKNRLQNDLDDAETALKKAQRGW